MIFNHLKHLESGEELAGLVVTPVDLKPLEAGLPVVVLDQGDRRPPEGATKKLGLPNLNQKQYFVTYNT